MATTVKITVYDGNWCLAAITGQTFYSLAEVGKEIQKFLTDKYITDCYQKNSFTSIGNVAANLIRFLVENPADTIFDPALSHSVSEHDLNFIVRLGEDTPKGDKIILRGWKRNSRFVEFPLYSVVPNIIRRVTFVYDKENGEAAKWRTLDVTEEDGEYISGLEDGTFKKFLLRRIVGGKILPA